MRAALKRANTSSVAAADSGTLITPDIPPLWDIGIAHTDVSAPGSNAYHSANWVVLTTTFRWLSIAPLGVPVVPPV